MVHDVLTERFAKHGKAYYTERNRLVRKELEQLKNRAKPGEKPADEYFALLDDLGAGVEALEDHDLAVHVLRGKLKEQEGLGFKGRQLYTTYANLGTFLIHGNFAKARTDDPAAKELLREGLNFIHKSIEVNPEAHFGREVWQAVAVEFMLAAVDDPSLLLKYDMVGDSLQAEVDPSQKRCLTSSAEWGRLGQARYSEAWLQQARPSTSKDDYQKQTWEHLRSLITRVGAEEGWGQAVSASHHEPAAFDEPTLGIVGMWRLGGGANPHFSLALGEIMLRVGQRYLAWTAYERAIGMADRFWPDTTIQDRFVEHCRTRQRLIETQLPKENWSERRQQFQDELAFGQGYQTAYQDHEARRIKEGASIDDPHFYDAFHTEHGPIASPVGPEDKFIVEKQGWESIPPIPFPHIFCFAGLCALGTACIMRITGCKAKTLSAS
jgi:hypothetical protein